MTEIELAINKVKNDYLEFLSLSDVMKANKKVILEAFKCYMNEEAHPDHEFLFDLLELDNSLKRDKQFMLDCIKIYSPCNIWFDDEIRLTCESIIAILKESCTQYSFFCEFPILCILCLDKIDQLLSCHKDFAMLKLNHESRSSSIIGNREFMLKAIKQNPKLLKYTTYQPVWNIEYYTTPELKKDISFVKMLYSSQLFLICVYSARNYIAYNMNFLRPCIEFL